MLMKPKSCSEKLNATACKTATPQSPVSASKAFGETLVPVVDHASRQFPNANIKNPSNMNMHTHPMHKIAISVPFNVK